MPNIDYLDSTGIPKGLTSDLRRTTLFNFWSVSCLPCLEELKEFTARADEIRAAGIDIVALSVDGLMRTDESTTDAARTILAETKFPFATGQATQKLAEALNLIHNSLTASAHELPVPTSFLVDQSGRLAAIYKGPVSVNKLISDVKHSSLSQQERFGRSAALPGRVIDHDVLVRVLDKGERLSRLSLASALLDRGWEAEAIVQYADLVESQHASDEVRTKLAQLLFRQGVQLAKQKLWRQAETAFSQATEHLPKYAQAHHNLGIVLEKLDH